MKLLWYKYTLQIDKDVVISVLEITEFYLKLSQWAELYQCFSEHTVMYNGWLASLPTSPFLTHTPLKHTSLA